MNEEVSNNKFIYIAVVVVLVGIIGYLLVTINNDGGEPAASGSYGTSQGEYGSGSTGTTNQFGSPRGDTAIIGELKTTLTAEPGNVDAHVRLGKAYFSMMQFDDAVKHFDAAIKLNPSLVDIYNDIALSNHYLGNSAKALSYVDKGIEMNPYYQRIWLTRGFILAYGLGDQDAALESFEKAISISPETPIAEAAREYLTEFNKGS